MPTEKQNVTFIKKLQTEYKKDAEAFRQRQVEQPNNSTELSARAAQAETAAAALEYVLEYITTGKSIDL